MKARLTTTCPRCDTDIVAGVDDIAMTKRGAVHVGCAGGGDE